MATSYAFGDVFGIRNSLHRSWREAKPFYALFTGLVVIAAGIVLIPGAPLGLYHERPWFLPFAGAYYKVLDWIS